MKIEAVVLDLGEVVVKLDFTRLFDLLGMEQGSSVALAIDKLNQWNLYDAFERGKVTPQAFHEGVCQSLGRQIPEDEFVRAWNSIVAGPVPGIEELLAKVAGQRPLYALTNSNELHISHCLKTFPWFSHFRKVFSSHDLGMRKPEAAIYETTLRLMGREGRHTLFVDDRMENITGARRAGLQAEHCPDPITSLPKILSNFNVL